MKQVEDTVKLYRAVGFEEYDKLSDGEKFSILEGGVNVKYFGRNLEETIIFANKNINKGLIAIFEVEIENSILLSIGEFVAVDTFIFKSGTVEIHEEHLQEFNNAIKYIKHVF